MSTIRYSGWSGGLPSIICCKKAVRSIPDVQEGRHMAWTLRKAVPADRAAIDALYMEMLRTIFPTEAMETGF